MLALCPQTLKPKFTNNSRHDTVVYNMSRDIYCEYKELKNIFPVHSTFMSLRFSCVRRFSEVHFFVPCLYFCTKLIFKFGSLTKLA